MSDLKRITYNDFIKQGEQLYGKDKKEWKFKCVSCGEVQTANDFIKADIKEPELYVHFSCIGRFVEGRGCDWTLGGFLTIHKKEVITEDSNIVPVFKFADE